MHAGHFLVLFVVLFW